MVHQAAFVLRAVTPHHQISARGNPVSRSTLVRRSNQSARRLHVTHTASRADRQPPHQRKLWWRAACTGYFAQLVIHGRGCAREVFLDPVDQRFLRSQHHQSVAALLDIIDTACTSSFDITRSVGTDFLIGPGGGGGAGFPGTSAAFGADIGADCRVCVVQSGVGNRGSRGL